jgi:hypothetical protein
MKLALVLTSFVPIVAVSSTSAMLEVASADLIKLGGYSHFERRLSRIRSVVSARNSPTAPAVVEQDHMGKRMLMASFFELLNEPTIVAATFDRLRRRQLQLTNASDSGSSCAFQDVVAGTCPLEQYCGTVFVPGENITCNAKVPEVWNMTLVSLEEFCLYISSNDVAPYDEGLFDPTQDVCFRAYTNISFRSLVPFVKEQTLQITRPKEGNFMEVSALVACNSTEDIVGYCGVCTQATVGSDRCNSCETCPAESEFSTALDCSNIVPDFISGCDTFLDKFVTLGEYLGVLCTFTQVTNGTCTLEEYCKWLQFDFGLGTDKAVCSGDASGNWSAEFILEEECYDNSTAGDSFGAPYNATTFDAASGDYCTNYSVILSFVGKTAVKEYTIETITRPLESAGSISLTSDLTSCDTAFPDYDFDGGFCGEECGKLIVGMEPCTSGCKTCPEDGPALTCTNLDERLVDSCDLAIDALTPALLAYFEKLNSEAAPVGTPTTSPPTAIGVAPTEPTVTGGVTPPKTSTPTGTVNSPPTTGAAQSTSAVTTGVWRVTAALLALAFTGTFL